MVWVYLLLFLPIPLVRFFSRHKRLAFDPDLAIAIGLLPAIVCTIHLGIRLLGYLRGMPGHGPLSEWCILLPVVAGLAPSALWHFPEIVRWIDYAFVKHPAAEPIATALRRGEPIDPETIAQALSPHRPTKRLFPAFHYKHQTERARALADKLRADAEVAEAVVRRERARAAEQGARSDSSSEWGRIIQIRPGKLR